MEFRMQNTNIDIVMNKKTVKKFDITNQSMAIKAVPNMDLVIRNKFSGKSPTQLKTKRQNNDLIVFTDNEEIGLVVQDYYTTQDVEILGVQDNGIASYGLNSSQTSQILGGGKLVPII